MKRIDPVIASLIHKSMGRDFERKETLTMTNEPEPNPRAGEALKPCKRCGAACRIEVFDSERVKATIWMCSNHSHFGGNCPDQIAYLSEQDWNTRPIPQPSEFGTAWQSAVEETDMLERELDLTNVDHVALWLEANAISPPLTHQLGWVACRITEAYEAQIAKLQADGDKLASALRGVLARDQLNTCDHPETHRGGTLWEICDSCGRKWADDEGGKPKWSDPPEWDAAAQALTEWKDRA